MDDPQRDVMDLQEAARYLDVGMRTLARQAADGQIPARKVGREWRFSRRAIDRYLAGEWTPR